MVLFLLAFIENLCVEDIVIKKNNTITKLNEKVEISSGDDVK